MKNCAAQTVSEVEFGLRFGLAVNRFLLGELHAAAHVIVGDLILYTVLLHNLEKGFIYKAN
jgi:hypothetical protein